MSQAGILTPAGGGGGGIDIRTITGNDAIAVGPNAAHNINLIGINGATVTNTAANTLSISPGTVATITTLDDIAVAIYSITVDPSSSVMISAMVTGAKSDFSASAWGQVVYGARRGAAGAAVGVEFAVNPGFGTDSAPLAIIAAGVFGNSLEIIVQGQAATTWNWKAVIQTVTQT